MIYNIKEVLNSSCSKAEKIAALENTFGDLFFQELSRKNFYNFYWEFKQTCGWLSGDILILEDFFEDKLKKLLAQDEKKFFSLLKEFKKKHENFVDLALLKLHDKIKLNNEYLIPEELFHCLLEVFYKGCQLTSTQSVFLKIIVTHQTKKYMLDQPEKCIAILKKIYSINFIFQYTIQEVLINSIFSVKKPEFKPLNFFVDCLNCLKVEDKNIFFSYLLESIKENMNYHADDAINFLISLLYWDYNKGKEYFSNLCRFIYVNKWFDSVNKKIYSLDGKRYPSEFYQAIRDYHPIKRTADVFVNEAKKVTSKKLCTMIDTFFYNHVAYSSKSIISTEDKVKLIIMVLIKCINYKNIFSSLCFTLFHYNKFAMNLMNYVESLAEKNSNYTELVNALHNFDYVKIHADKIIEYFLDGIKDGISIDFSSFDHDYIFLNKNYKIDIFILVMKLFLDKQEVFENICLFLNKKEYWDEIVAKVESLYKNQNDFMELKVAIDEYNPFKIDANKIIATLNGCQSEEIYPKMLMIFDEIKYYDCKRKELICIYLLNAFVDNPDIFNTLLCFIFGCRLLEEINEKIIIYELKISNFAKLQTLLKNINFAEIFSEHIINVVKFHIVRKMEDDLDKLFDNMARNLLEKFSYNETIYILVNVIKAFLMHDHVFSILCSSFKQDGIYLDLLKYFFEKKGEEKVYLKMKNFRHLNCEVALSYSSIIGCSMLSNLGGNFTGKSEGLNFIMSFVDYRKVCPKASDEKTFYQKKISDEIYQKAFSDAISLARIQLADKNALIIPGNSCNVPPEFFGGKNDKSPSSFDYERAIAEIAYIYVAMQMGMPIFAICGGHQLLNVYLGGTVTNLTASDLKYQPVGKSSPVTFFKSMFLPKIKEEERGYYGAHRQYVSQVGGEDLIVGASLDSTSTGYKNYLEVVARSPDGKIEACESRFGAPILSVQFHPEAGDELGMIHSFKKSIKTYYSKKKMLAELQSFPRFFKAASKSVVTESEASHLIEDHTAIKSTEIRHDTTECVNPMQVCLNRYR